MLYYRVMQAQSLPTGHPARRWFSGMVEQVFQAELGVCSPQLTEYLGDMLVELIHVDQVYRYTDATGNSVRELADLVANAHQGVAGTDAHERREVHRHIGDFTLFWAGVYPEQLRPRHARVDRLFEFMQRGKQAYGIAGDLTRADEHPPAAVLRELSAQFECCVEGLHRVRAAWERDAVVRR